MAEFLESSDDRTESPTAYRREEFRRQGKVAISRELMSSGVLVASLLFFYLFLFQWKLKFGDLATLYFSFSTKEFNKEILVDLCHKTFLILIPLLGPFSVLLLLMIFLVGIAQVGFHFSSEPLQPDWERLNPVAGLQRFLSGRSFVELFKNFLKFLAVFLIIYFFIKNQIFTAASFFEYDLLFSLHRLFSDSGKLFVNILGVFLALAAADYLYQRFQFEKSLKMTKREAKDEFKLREGDPLIRNRIKALQRKMARSRMIDQVPKADVVITNPTHIAIALKYDFDSMPSPRVIAKGAGVVAQKIKEVARANQIPCVENKPLARSLYKALDINEFIPRELFKAVAEVLAYVYRLKGRTSLNAKNSYGEV